MTWAAQHERQSTGCAYPDRLLTLKRSVVRLAMLAYSGGSDPVSWLAVRSSLARAWCRAKEAGSVPAKAHSLSSCEWHASWHARAVPAVLPCRHRQRKAYRPPQRATPNHGIPSFAVPECCITGGTSDIHTATTYWQR